MLSYMLLLPETLPGILKPLPGALRPFGFSPFLYFFIATVNTMLVPTGKS
jgi:hypothetical protein